MTAASSAASDGATAAGSLPYVDAETVAGLSWDEAVDALGRALHDGLDPEAGTARQVVPVANGQLLLMPAESSAGVGVKVATVAPGNPDRGRPRIQGLYLLLDHGSLTPVALLDGIALTNLRTPAVSALATRHLAVPEAHHLVVFGCGPQGRGHLEAIRAVRPIESVTVVGRDPARAEAMADWAGTLGVAAAVGDAGSVADADIVVCATTARRPVFEGHRLPDHACVVAVGSHEPDARELDDTVLERAARGGRIVVESRSSALSECGDVILALASGAIGPPDLTALTSAVRLDPPEGIGVFKSSGMGWEDLVVAGAVLDTLGSPEPSERSGTRDE